MSRIITEPIWMEPEAIEAKAMAMLKAYETRFGKISELPIPIEHLIEAHLDLWIDWDEIAEDEDEIILAYIDPDARKICMNEARRDHFEEYLGTDMFAFAHEVGHWDLHVIKTESVQLGLPQLIHSKRFLCRGNKQDRLEWQANRYAGALLMPEHLVRREIRNLNIYRWPSLYSLKNRFGVTISALRKRLEELGHVYVSPEGTLHPSREAYTNQSSLLLR